VNLQSELEIIGKLATILEVDLAQFFRKALQNRGVAII
jgi:hypothetical protein